jgi:hypothetical protein
LRVERDALRVENAALLQRAEAAGTRIAELTAVIEAIRPIYERMKDKQSYLMNSYERLLYAKIQAAITALDHIGGATGKAGDQS